MVHVKSLESETGSRLRGLVLKICVGYANFLVEFRVNRQKLVHVAVRIDLEMNRIRLAAPQRFNKIEVVRCQKRIDHGRRYEQAILVVGFSLLSANERETKNHLLCRWKTRKEL